MEILGQDKLLNLIDSFTLDSFPRTSLLSGPYGSGKHMICEYIANRLQLTMRDLGKEIEDPKIKLIDLIEQIQLTTSPSLYIIDITLLTEKKQNILLKFLEEPLKNSYIIALCQNKDRVIPTISNRCKVFTLSNYTKEILSRFIEIDIDNNFVYDIIKTPGEARDIKGDKLSDIFDLANKMITKINHADLSNTLTISDKVKFRGRKNDIISKEEESKLDCFLLIRTLLVLLHSLIVKENNKWYYKAYQLTQNLSIKLDDTLYNLGMDQKFLFIQYLVDMWEASRDASK